MLFVVALTGCIAPASDGAGRPVGTPPADSGAPLPDDVTETIESDSGTEPPPPGEVVFDTAVLHVIEITVDAAWLPTLEDDREERVPCTFTFDGITLTEVGIRQKGYLGSSDTLDGKPGFSVKFDSFVDDTTLDGLHKLLLNNAKEDDTWLSEHIGYQAYRDLGQRATYTSHALVRFNGQDKGLYVLREPVASDFLERVFGEGNDDGNLYEGVYNTSDQRLGDFVTHPDLIELKDEVEEERSRDDLVAVAAIVDQAPDADFVGAVEAVFDLDGFVTGFALDTELGYWDSYAYFLNNYYLYHDPGDDRFHYLPHGMDQLQYQVLGDPMGRLAIRVNRIAELRAQVDAERQRVRDEWDTEGMLARIDAVESILAAAVDPGPTSRADIGAFRARVDAVRDAVTEIGER